LAELLPAARSCWVSICRAARICCSRSNGESLVDDRLEVLRDDVRTSLRDERIGYTGLSLQGEAVQLRIRDLDRLDDAENVLEGLAAPADPCRLVRKPRT
jgi:hypothetical protein